MMKSVNGSDREGHKDYHNMETHSHPVRSPNQCIAISHRDLTHTHTYKYAHPPISTTRARAQFSIPHEHCVVCMFVCQILFFIPYRAVYSSHVFFVLFLQFFLRLSRFEFSFLLLLLSFVTAAAIIVVVLSIFELRLFNSQRNSSSILCAYIFKS